LFDIAALFAARASGVLIALVFLPLYARLMPVADFGVVAVVLTLQAAIQVFDLGTSMTVSREVARHDATWTVRRQRAQRLLVVSERGLWLLYAGAGAVFTSWSVWSSGTEAWSGHSWLTVVLAVGFGLFTILQNLFGSALVASQRYVMASTTQVFGGLGRAGLTVAVLLGLTPTLHVFLAVQTVCLLVHYLWTRHLAMQVLARGTREQVAVSSRHWIYMMRESLPFMLLSAAGAIATQADKPIIAAVVSAAAVAPYYLASTYALAPVAVIAFPIAQYFQPRLIGAEARGNIAGSQKVARQFAMMLMIAVAAPVAALLLLAPELTAVWLHGVPRASEVAQLSHALVVGAAASSLTFVAYVLLTLGKDASFMARAGAVLTALTVPAYVAAAWKFGADAVAVVGMVYQVVMMAVFWWRALTLQRTAQLARAALGGCRIPAGMLVPWALAFVLVAQYAMPWSTEWLLSCAALGLIYGGVAVLLLRSSLRTTPSV
jgi:O-antigen/teichoic acid export membrane protein